MTTYIVSYDLISGGDYARLYEALKASKAWAKVTESTWAIVTDETATEVRDRLAGLLKENDRIFVVKSGVQAAWKNSKCKNEWLKKWL
ncbi:hypothetical protein [Cypionkella psychrotolerans]|uniref:hypothetical protein n=1 Tax=Cypionkella psychrotolerans TaxID=1678131 RepID=UPI000B00CBD0|nr:hypothetical protein [Cypionkella psychrotolerans]